MILQRSKSKNLLYVRHSCKPILHNSIRIFRKIKKTNVAPNFDTPEAGLDGLMQVNHTDLVAPEMRPKLQVLLCKDRIGFKPDRSHLVVFMTDAPSHIAGDGLIGGLWRPYNHTCQLEPRPQKDGSKLEVYWGLDHDYPSLSEVNYLLEKEELRVLFATPKPILPLYEMLVETKVKSEV